MQLFPLMVKGWVIVKSSGISRSRTPRCWNNYKYTNGSNNYRRQSVSYTTSLLLKTTWNQDIDCVPICKAAGYIRPQEGLRYRRVSRLFATSTSLTGTPNTQPLNSPEHQQNDEDSSNQSLTEQEQDEDTSIVSSNKALPVWNHPAVQDRVLKKKRNNNLRFRQHVNPLARIYQQSTILPENWPSCVYTNINRNHPLHLDIGCSKGGFLIDLCQKELNDDQQQQQENDSKITYNYLGLEIRPAVAAYAKERIAIHKLTGILDFLGCNANVDLDRLLQLYQKQYDTNSTADTSTTPPLTAVTGNNDNLCLHRVTIQFPDPHFKTQHIKRRVVTQLLVDTIAKYMPPNIGTIILQSDIQSVFDDMRKQFRDIKAPLSSMNTTESNNENNEEESNHYYFKDSIDALDQYISENSLGVPTEREQSVLVQGLPVYRALLTRTDCPYHPSAIK